MKGDDFGVENAWFGKDREDVGAGHQCGGFVGVAVEHRETDERASEFTGGVCDGVPEIIKDVCLVLGRRASIVAGTHL